MSFPVATEYPFHVRQRVVAPRQDIESAVTVDHPLRKPVRRTADNLINVFAAALLLGVVALFVAVFVLVRTAHDAMSMLNGYLADSDAYAMANQARAIMRNGNDASNYVASGTQAMSDMAIGLSTQVNQTGVEVLAAMHGLTLALTRLSSAGLNVVIPEQ